MTSLLLATTVADMSFPNRYIDYYQTLHAQNRAQNEQNQYGQKYVYYGNYQNNWYPNIGGKLVSESPLAKDDKGYHFGYYLSDGQRREEWAQIIPTCYDYFGYIETGESILRVKGVYSFVDPQSRKIYTTYYVADENGYRAYGDHIPKWIIRVNCEIVLILIKIVRSLMMLLQKL